MLATLGARLFSAAAPALWNSLSVHICDIESLCALRDKLRHIFLD